MTFERSAAGQVAPVQRHGVERRLGRVGLDERGVLHHDVLEAGEPQIHVVEPHVGDPDVSERRVRQVGADRRRPARSATRVSVASCSPAPESSQSSSVTSISVAPRRSAAVSRTAVQRRTGRSARARGRHRRDRRRSSTRVEVLAAALGRPERGRAVGWLGRSGIGVAAPACAAIRCSRLDRGDQLDLDRDVERELGEPDRGARVPAGVAEHLDEQVGAAVDDRRASG